MAGRRKGPRKRQQSSSQTLVTVTSVVAFVFTLCLCVFNFDLNGETHPRLETCRSTCDGRLQSAALESHLSSSLSPSTMDSLFLRRESSGSHTTLHSKANNFAKPAATQVRPRRLPTLIKILTGFDDDQNPAGGNANGHKSIIARIEKPDFIKQAQQKNRGAGTTEPLSHEETVQIAAAAAAAAVFSKSIRIFGNNRMHRVNSEWDAALRWIAGWDQHQQQQQKQQIPSLDGGKRTEPPIRANENNGSTYGGISSQEGYNTFVDDLARMMESCISQCVEDENFDTRLGKEEESGLGVVLGGLSIGNLVLKSLFGWIAVYSFPKISFGKLDAISSESKLILGRTFQLAVSSVAVYALHSLWIWVSPALHQWYSTLGYTESPEWLLEHEKELEKSKNSSRSRQKKKKRRQANRHPSGRVKAAASSSGAQRQSHLDKRTSVADIPEQGCRDSTKEKGKILSSDNAASKELAKEHASDTGVLHRSTDITEQTSKDSVSGSQDSSESIPSMISYPSTSASSSPAMKPIGSHLEDRDLSLGPALQGPPLLGLSSKVSRQATFLPQLDHTKALPVPTQKQRNEASKQLRDFQNAQIQRLLLQRKLSQISNVSRPSAPSPVGSGLLSGSSFHSDGAVPAVSGQNIKVLRPPPGLSHPSSETPIDSLQPTQDDKAFLTDNELFLSKLLDDDEEEGENVEVPSSLLIDIGAMSPEPSLDPSAAPFVSSGKVFSTNEPSAKCLFPNSKEGEKDAWQSSSNGLLKETSPLRIKGVYGGSVW
eukprot:CAMPEP_0183714014 /NCGR_PEP_ID=MMETSP0737-20130205/8722_1 /TAXON_ID=385413 /ORGANISM="Thalassiosira miniscula, Strain CCMP1093" /LENGTH=768 /DNA_ID=CAMNT_0025942919 /DNA_START=249 /DNA_END=2552 /DNA_ORIENTATION=-